MGTAVELLESVVKLKGFLPFEALRVPFVVNLFCNINISALQIPKRGSLGEQLSSFLDLLDEIVLYF